MSNQNLVNHLDARCNLRVPANSIAMRDTRASMPAVQTGFATVLMGTAAAKPAAVAYERIVATWVHTPKFGPDHHSQRWRPAS